ARRGLAARAAIAGTPDAARALARFHAGAEAGGPPVLAVPPGEEAAHIRPLPLAALGLDAERRLALGRAGLKTVADLADRPRAPLAARFGADLISRLERTLGEAGAPISPRRPPPVFMVEQNFAEPIARIADALATLRALAGELMPRMERRGEGGRRFEASFFRSDGAVRRVDLATSLPCRDAPALARLFDERLEALSDPLDPGFGFDLIRLAALVTEPLAPRQARLDGDAEPAEAVAALVDRLAARYGPARTVRLAPRDSHIPERVTRRLPAALTNPDATLWPDVPALDRPPHRPLSLFDPPQPVEALAEVPDGPPLRFRWRRVLHEIARAEGPERIAAEWWREASDAPTRDYYQVEDAEGRRFWLFREGLYEREVVRPRWFLHGLFA
ncbi:MAG TPA: DNA polymerase Y family protein, partial [Xanthobacteraceae bacterium]|nr:DNA polymerase Y family protein [Xanthobacteraceae bacterium]